MPKRKSRDGSQVDPHAIKLEKMYQDMFDWFKREKGINKTDVIRNAVDEYYSSMSGLSPELLSQSDLRTRIQKGTEELKIVESKVNSATDEISKIKKTYKCISKNVSAMNKHADNIASCIEP